MNIQCLCNEYSFYLPQISGKIHPTVRKKPNALVFEHLPLYALAAERKSGRHAALAVDYAVTGDHARLRIDVQSVAHNSCPPRISAKRGHLTVGCHRSFGDSFYNLVYLAEHISFFCHRKIPFQNYNNRIFSKYKSGGKALRSDSLKLCRRFLHLVRVI